ncbi:hypothetical protein ACHAWF_007210 [Thalassiosira exigua]
MAFAKHRKSRARRTIMISSSATARGAVAAAVASLAALAAAGSGVAASASASAYVSPSPADLARARSRRGRRPAAVDADAGRNSINDVDVRGDAAEPLARPVRVGPSSPPGPHVRVQKRGRNYDVQTAVTTFEKPGDPKSTTVDLHAQIHFGDASYFDYFNDEETGSRYDRVLYELLVEERFLTPSSVGGGRLKKLEALEPGSELNPVAPTAADRNTAAQYGLKCQVDGIRYCREGWIHADLTREEFLAALEGREKQKKEEERLRPFAATDDRRPLWALASTAATYPGSELVTSLLRPLTTDANGASAALTRRLFTHLFFPGDALSSWIRAALWFGVPSPELSILLVDWSSLSHLGKGRRRRRRGGGRGGEGEGIAPVSPVAAPVLLSLLTGNWGTARRLVFGQILAGGRSSEDDSKGGVLIRKRNERALDVLREVRGEGDAERVALLYGAMHCRDLRRRLEGEGYVPVRTEWRTAFSAAAPRWGDYGFDVDDWKAKSGDLVASTLPPSVAEDGARIVKSMPPAALESAAVGLVVLPLYLLIGGYDWASTLGDVGTSVDAGAYLDGLAAATLYLVRHAALYVGMSKFVVDWGGEGAFEEE